MSAGTHTHTHTPFHSSLKLSNITSFLPLTFDLLSSPRNPRVDGCMTERFEKKNQSPPVDSNGGLGLVGEPPDAQPKAITLVQTCNTPFKCFEAPDAAPLGTRPLITSASVLCLIITLMSAPPHLPPPPLPTATCTLLGREKKTKKSL